LSFAGSVAEFVAEIQRELSDEMVEQLLRPPAWHRDALCREYPSVDFFATSMEKQAIAKAVCARCLVRVECAAAAARYDRTVGVWGGEVYGAGGTKARGDAA